MKLSPEELEEMRADGRSSAVRAQFAAGARAVAAWDRAQPRRGLVDALDWSEQQRRVFGDPEVDLTPWQGDDYRL